jgi:hypothetical protein
MDYCSNTRFIYGWVFPIRTDAAGKKHVYFLSNYSDVQIKLIKIPVSRGGSRIFRTSVNFFLADGALSALGVSIGRGRLHAWGGGVGAK